MNESILQITILQVALGYVFVLVVVALLKTRGIAREKELLWASLRMTLQLTLVGFLLVWVFDIANLWLSALIVFLMLTFATYTIIRKFYHRLSPAMMRRIALSVPLGTLPVLGYFMAVVVPIRPMYDPQYLIPITGMIIGNSMTGISLGLQTMLNHYEREGALIEEALMLGATPKEASRTLINQSFDAALLPTINSMLGMGIIFLPGMMTGQILSGVVPTTAILYQLAIMMGILGGVSLTTYTFIMLGYRTFFNAQAQLIDSPTKVRSQHHDQNHSKK